MKVERYNVTNPKKYKTKDGEEKTFWASIGKITIFTKDDNSKSGILELNDRNAQYSLFLDEPREKKETQSSSSGDEVETIDVPF